MSIALTHFIQRDPLTAAPETRVSDAIIAMSQERSSYVLVVQAGKVSGILTEQDVVRIVAIGQPLDILILADVMTRPVITQMESELGDLFDGSQQSHHERNLPLPIVDADQHLIGILTPQLLREALRQQRLETIAAREDRYCNILDNLTELVCRYQAKGTLTYVNQAYCDFFGQPPEALLGKSFLAFLPAADRARCEQTIATLTQTKGQGFYEHWEQHSSGEKRWLGWETHVICDAAGHVVEFQSLGRDLTETKRHAVNFQQAEVVRQQSEAELRAVLSTVSDLVITFDRQGRYLSVATANQHLLSRPIEELLGTTLHQVLPPELAAAFIAKIQQILDTQQTATLEYKLVVGGQERWLAGKGAPLGAETVVWAIHDITEVRREEMVRKQTEVALQTTEAVLSQTLERVAAVITRFSILPSGKCRNDYFSPGCEQLYGYSAEELLADRGLWISRVLAEDRETILPCALKVLKQESISTVKFRFRHRDGSLRWIAETLSAEWSETTQTWLVSSLQVDCTDRQLAEAALRESEERFRQLAENISQVFYLASTHRPEVYYVNPAYEKMWGRSRQNADYPRSFIEAIHLEDLPRFLDTLALRRQGEATVLEYRISQPDGSLRWICDRGFPVLNPDGEIYRVAGIAEDITDRKATDLELRQAKETAELASQAKGQFLSHMSHELRTPLNVMLGFSQLLHREPDLIPEYRDYLQLILSSGEHLLALINDVLEMSKIDAGRASLSESSFDLYQMLDRLESMLRLKAESKQLTLHFDRAVNVPQFIQTDEGKLRQVLLNLLSNALKFTDRGGVVLRVWAEDEGGEVEGQRGQETGTQTEDLTNTSLLSPYSLAPAPNSLLHFEVEDTGCGIAAAEIDYLFQAFVQTEAGRRSQQGTGLGLSISQQFVQLMGGKIRVSSLLGQGSIFGFTVQVRSAVVAVQAAVIPAEARSRGEIVGLAPGHSPCRILVAEDQPTNRLLTVKLLTQVGFEVQEVADGKAAIDRWQRWQPDLILMDMQMPILDGYQATQEIRLREQAAPATKVVALTAFAFEEQRSRMLAAGCDDCVCKPFRIRDLLLTIAQHLQLSYVYAASEAPLLPTFSQDVPFPTLLLSELSEMPESWRVTLHQYSIQLDSDRCLPLIQMLPLERSRLAADLMELINNFRFDLLIQALQQLE